MEWLPYVHDAIDYIEANLLEVSGPQEVADKLFLSEPYLQKGFHILTGYSVGEYIRNRRLYEAALELRKTDRKISDIAFCYGYESQESFTKAFTRFHGVSPVAARKETGGEYPGIRQFLPITIEMKVLGGSGPNFKILRKGRMVFVGFVRELSSDSSEEEESFREEVRRRFLQENGRESGTGNQEETILRDFVWENAIGEYGIILEQKKGKTSYMLAGRFSGGELPEGVETVSMEAAYWAVFDGAGVSSGESVNTVIRESRERLEKYSEYQPDSERVIEWFEGIGDNPNPAGKPTSVWIPVREKKQDRQNDKKIGKTFIKALSVGILLILLAAGTILGISHAMRQKDEKENNIKYSGNQETQPGDVEETIKEVLLSEGLEPAQCRTESGAIKLYYMTSGDGTHETEEDRRVIERVKRVLTDGGTEEITYPVILLICSDDGSVLFTEACEFHFR